MKRALLTFLLIATIIMSGCWDKREINELAFVQGVMIDKSGDNIRIMLHILKPSMLTQAKGGRGGGGSSRSGGGGEKPYLLMEETASTVSKALDKFDTQLSRSVFIQQNEIFFISERLARSGLKDILDVLSRNKDFRRTSFLMVLKGSPDDILKIPAGLEQIPYKEVLGAIKMSANTSVAYITNINDFYKALSKDIGMQPIMGTIEIVKKGGKPSGIKVEGAGIFDKDKLVGFTNCEETSGLLFINNKMKNGVLTITNDTHGKKCRISLTISTSKTNVKPILKDNKLYMSIDIRVETVLDEQESTIDYTIPKNIEELQLLVNNDIKNRVQLALNKIQKQYKVDVFGFGDRIHKYYPAVWKQVQGHWSEIFPELPVEVKVRSTIIRTGTTTKPPEY